MDTATPTTIVYICQLILSVSQVVPAGLGTWFGLETHYYDDAYCSAAWRPQQDYGHNVLDTSQT